MRVEIATPDQVMKAIYNPEVKKHLLGPYETVDLTDFFADKESLSLRIGEAVVLFPKHPDKGAYEAHFAFPPSVRGKAAVLAATQMLEFMFTKRKACVIYGQTPRLNRAARLINSVLGFQISGTSKDDLDRPCVDYELRRESWVLLSEGSLAA